MRPADAGEAASTSNAHDAAPETHSPVLAEALRAEREGRVLESFRLVHAALAERSDDAAALTLLGRLCLLGGDVVAAVGMHRLALAHDRANAQAQTDLQRALDTISDRGGAAALLDRVLASEPSLSDHHFAPGSLAPVKADVAALVDESLALDPTCAAAHATTAAIAARDLRLADALLAYRRAMLLAPDEPVYRLAASQCSYALGNAEDAAALRTEAFAQRTVYRSRERSRARRSVLVLMTPAAWTANASLEFAVDHDRFALHLWYLTDVSPSLSRTHDSSLPLDRLGVTNGAELPPCDVVFTAIGEAETAAPALAAATRFAGETAVRVINNPRMIANTARPALARALAGVAGVSVPRTVRYAVGALRRGYTPSHASTFAFPLLARPVDEHGGRNLERIENAAQLEEYADRVVAPAYDLTAYVDYRSNDGFFRKYRVMCVERRPFAYHLAISPQWMVHYNSAPMDAEQWMRDEEAAFLAQPEAVFADWDRVFPEIAQSIGLDYFGIDCALLPDGRILIFEADVATWVHDESAESIFAYKRPSFRRLAHAIEAMLS